MQNDQTPVEGKGKEMIPDRGLPFEDDNAVEENAPMNIHELAEPEDIEGILERVPEDVPQSPEEPAPEPLNSPSDSETIHQIPDKLLNIEEIRGREMELSEDSHTTAPDFEGEADTDFATTRTPVPLSSATREAIMLESGAGIIGREVMDAEKFQDSLDESAPVDETSDVAASVSEEAPPTPVETTKTKTIVVQETTGTEPFFSKESFELPGPISPEAEVKPPETAGDLKATKKMLDLLITNKTVEALWHRADDLQTAVIENIEDLGIARSLLEHIRSARTRLLEKKDNYEEAERELNEVEFRLSYNQRSHQWRGLGYGILIYEIVWGILLLIVTGILLFGGENSLRIQESTLVSRSDVFIGLGGMLWGGMGGVVGALHALWRYITAQKFNPQYNIWYFSQPIMGVFIGAFIFLFIKIGFNVTAGNPNLDIGSPWMVYLIGFIAGFQQNVLYDIVKQVLKLFRFGGDSGKPADGDSAG